MYHETISCDYEGCKESVQVPADADALTLWEIGWKFYAWEHLCPQHAARLPRGMGVPIELDAARTYELERRRRQTPAPKIMREDLRLGADGLVQ